MLTDTDRAILDLERAWWRNPGSKEQRIRAEFDWSATRYYQPDGRAAAATGQGPAAAGRGRLRA